MAAGQPTKYKTAYCVRLIKWMEKGMSFESFAGDVSVHKDTLYEWVKVHPEFSDAKRQAFAKGQVFWEKMGIHGAAGKLKNFNNGAWIFNMKNRFNWRDKQDVVTRDETFKPIKDMSEDEIEDRLDYALRILESDEQSRDDNRRSKTDSKTRKGKQVAKKKPAKVKGKST